MIAVIGYLGILVALGAAVKLAVDGIRLARRSEFDATGLGHDALVLLVGAVVAFVALEGAILAHDFSIEYVADNSARTTPFVFSARQRLGGARGQHRVVGHRARRVSATSSPGELARAMGSAPAPSA